MTITSAAARRSAVAAITLVVSGCQQRSAPADARTEANAATAAAMACAGDSLHPVAAAPAAGLWIGSRVAPPLRVAAMIGPASADGDRARLTRRVETLELRDGRDSIRLTSDTASARLELLPPFPARGETSRPAPAHASMPAAVYAIGPQVLLAAYEPCAASPTEPRIRYLRRDHRGVVATDLMLRRDSGQAATGAIP